MLVGANVSRLEQCTALAHTTQHINRLSTAIIHCSDKKIALTGIIIMYAHISCTKINTLHTVER